MDILIITHEDGKFEISSTEKRIPTMRLLDDALDVVCSSIDKKEDEKAIYRFNGFKEGSSAYGR